MQGYVLALENIGYTLINEIRIFSQNIGQSTEPSVTFNIYREIMAQVISAYANDQTEVAHRLSALPVWPTILYIEDKHEFFDMKREFAARVRFFAMAIYGLIQTKIPDDYRTRRTYLMETVTATLLIVNVYDNVSVDAEYS